MDTYQAIIYGIIHGFSEFLPIDSLAHIWAVPEILGWPAAPQILLGGLTLGGLLAVLVYFRHDWLSMISCSLQVFVYRKKPMTLDERMPFFILLASIPPAIAWFYGREYVEGFELTSYRVAGLLALFGLPLAFSDYWSRKNKALPDWNWIDAIVAGILQCLFFVPGCGRMTAVLTGACLRNYNREAAAKFAFFSAAPILAGLTFFRLKGIDFHAPAPTDGMTWLAFGIAGLVSFLTSLLAIGGFMKNVMQKGYGRYAIYRLIAAGGLALTFWIKNR